MTDEYGEVTMCWVKRDAKLASRFGDIDDASVRAMMLDHSEQQDAPPPAALDFDVIDIVDCGGCYTTLASRFGATLRYWIVDQN